MDKNFFGEQIDRLRKTYAPGAVNEERINLLWAKFRNVENRVFQNAMDYLISEYTTQTLPAFSKFVEAVGMFRTSVTAKIDYAIPHWDCEPCEDRGWSFIGHTVTACVCHRGQQMHPETIHKYQQHYNAGRKLFRSPFDKEAPKPSGERIFPSLPYDPSSRFET